MNTLLDNITTVESLKNDVKKFIEEREWQQFHSPKNLSMGIVSEATELLDLFLWCDNNASYQQLEDKRKEVEDEIADLVYMALAFCVRHNIDLSSAMNNKRSEAAQKYPIEKCKGKAVKYTVL